MGGIINKPLAHIDALSITTHKPPKSNKELKSRSLMAKKAKGYPKAQSNPKKVAQAAATENITVPWVRRWEAASSLGVSSLPPTPPLTLLGEVLEAPPAALT